LPVRLGIGTRFWLPILGMSFEEYWSSPRKMLEAQLVASKWIMENIRDDRYGITVSPDFQNVREASGLGCELTFREGFPWIKEPIIRIPPDVQKLKGADMTKLGLTGRIVEYMAHMRDLIGEWRMVLEDGPIEIDLGSGMGTDGPLTNVSWIRGARNLLSDIITNPQLVHEMMDLVTEKIIDYNHHLREMAGIPKDCGMGLADDFAAYLSPDQYREFALPYHHRIYEAFGTKERGIHLCGKIDHLLELLVREERIHSLDGFGWVTSPTILAKVMGGKVLLYGGPSPSLILEGPEERIINSCREYIELFDGLGGYALGDGYNIAPGTPLSHLNSLMAAAERYASHDLDESKR